MHDHNKNNDLPPENCSICYVRIWAYSFPGEYKDMPSAFDQVTHGKAKETSQ